MYMMLIIDSVGPQRVNKRHAAKRVIGEMNGIRSRSPSLTVC